MLKLKNNIAKFCYKYIYNKTTKSEDMLIIKDNENLN